jgi:hypothetical protein
MGIVGNRVNVNDNLTLRKDTHKPMVHLTVKQTDFLYKFFIPFLDKLTFVSKKRKDYLE